MRRLPCSLAPFCGMAWLCLAFWLWGDNATISGTIAFLSWPHSLRYAPRSVPSKFWHYLITGAACERSVFSLSCFQFRIRFLFRLLGAICAIKAGNFSGWLAGTGTGTGTGIDQTVGLSDKAETQFLGFQARVPRQECGTVELSLREISVILITD